MKKITLLFSALLFVAVVNAQSDASVIINTTNTGPFPSVGSSGSDNSFIATLPSGENIVADVLFNSSTSNYLINIKKINTSGSVSTLTNLIVPYSAVPSCNFKGLSCSSSGTYTCLFGELADLYLVKFSASGTIIWQKSINAPDVASLYYNHSLNETPSGEYYISLSSYAFMGIIKIDVNGNLLWNKRLAGPRDDGKCPGFCTEVTLSGGCITTLKDNSYETLINLAPDGTLNWSRSFGDFSYRWTKSIKADKLGNFYVMGTYGSSGNAFIQKVDANGNIIYAKNMAGGITYQDAYVTSSNELIILSEFPNYRLSKIGATGNILWSKGIGAVNGGNAYSTATVFSKSPSTNINLLAKMNDTTALVLKFASDLSEICNTFNYGPENTSDDTQILGAEIDSVCNISPLTVTINNTGFATSSTEYYSSKDFCSFVASVNAIAAVDLNVYPNPASDFINIELGNIKTSDLQNAMLIVYNITGQKVFEKELNTSSMDKISTAEYPAGLYTIVITNADKMLAKQRVIVQK